VKVGNLYRFDRMSGHRAITANGRLAIYLGEDFIHRDDGVTVENHKVLMVGANTPTVIDRGLLKYMREVTA